jgi:hypothetical protein
MLIFYCGTRRYFTFWHGAGMPIPEPEMKQAEKIRLFCGKRNEKVKMMAKKEKPDPEVEALVNWCIAVEKCLVAGGATLAEAQDHIEEQAEWFTDLFYDGLTPEEAAKEALN